MQPRLALLHDTGVSKRHVQFSFFLLVALTRMGTQHSFLGSFFPLYFWATAPTPVGISLIFTRTFITMSGKFGLRGYFFREFDFFFSVFVCMWRLRGGRMCLPGPHCRSRAFVSRNSCSCVLLLGQECGAAALTREGQIICMNWVRLLAELLYRGSALPRVCLNAHRLRYAWNLALTP